MPAVAPVGAAAGGQAGLRVGVLVETGWWGGLEMHTMDLVRALTQAGHRPVIACVGDRTRALFEAHCRPEVPLTTVTAPGSRGWIGWWRSLRALDADVVLHQKGTLNSGSLSLDLVLRARFGHLTTVEHLEPPPVPPPGSRRHLGGLVPGVGLWRHLWKVRGWCRSLAPTRIVCVSDSVRRALRTDYGFPGRKMLTVRNGIDVERFRPDPSLGRRMREAWQVPAGAHVFGSVRRFVRDKGLDVLIDAFARVTGAGPVAPVLVLVGDGPEEAALRAQAVRLGVAERVVFHGFTKRPWEVYPGFDTFVIPSRVEALGVVVVEAMASGCLVVGTRVGGIPEMIRDSSLGALVAPEDPNSLAAAMWRASAMSAGERGRTAERNRAYAVSNFSAHRQFLTIVGLLDGRSSTVTLGESVACT